MFGNLAQMAALLKQAKEMQRKMADVQRKLAASRVEANAGGGMVTVIANGHQEILSIKFDPAVVKPDELELLEELTLAAVNAARRKAEALAKEEMKSLADGIELPEGFTLPEN